MFKHKIPHPAGTITHWTSDEAAHKALKKRLETPVKVKLNAFERAGNRPIDRPTFREKHPNWRQLVDDYWPIYQELKVIVNYDTMRRGLALHLDISLYQSNCLCRDIRAKYILGVKK